MVGAGVIHASSANELESPAALSAAADAALYEEPSTRGVKVV
jgi:hypothetical protein